MGHYPPNNLRELLNLLNKLGFVCTNAGKHNYKFKHPFKKPADRHQPHHIPVSTNVYKAYSRKVIKQIMKFGFTEEEIKKACGKKIH